MTDKDQSIYQQNEESKSQYELNNPNYTYDYAKHLAGGSYPI